MSVGSRLREERQRLELSLVAMAKAGGVSRTSQIDYEQDKADMKGAYLAALADKGVDVIYVLTGRRSADVALSKEEAFVLAQYRRTDVYAKQAMNTLFERLGQVRYSNNDYPKHLEPNNHPAARGEEES